MIIEIPYKPRPLQKELHEAIDQARFWAVVAHRRFGKSVLAVNHLIRAAVTCQRKRPRVGYIGPTYRQSKLIAWDYAKHYVKPIPGCRVNETELRIDFPNDARLSLYGADNPDSLRGIYLDQAVLDEYGLMKPNVYREVVRPALADRHGGAGFIGTPNGKNQFSEICDYAKTEPGWFFGEYRASQTGLIPQAELDDAKRLMTEDLFLQEFECSFEAAIHGAIYAKELQAARDAGRITRVPYDPALPVATAWDLGVGDSTAIWFIQLLGMEARLIDYYETSGEGLPHYAKVLQDRGYIYGRHIAPHDIAVRELGSGRSRIEVAASLGIKFEIAPAVPLEDGIHAARLWLGRTWIDEVRCKVGLESLQHYRWALNERLGELKSTPVHDFSSHAADAFRYAALALKDKPQVKAAQTHRETYRGEAGWMR